MRRFKFGPTLSQLVVLAVSPSGKADVEVVYNGQSKPGVFDFEVPAYDLADHSKLVTIHAVFVPEGQGVPSSAELAVHSDYPKFTADVSQLQSGGVVSIDANAAPAGNYAGLAVLEFEDEEPAAQS